MGRVAPHILVLLCWLRPVTATPYQVSAWTFGDAASLTAAADRSAVDEVDVDWYHSQGNGTVVATDEDLAFVRDAHGRGVRVLATVTNTRLRGGFAAGIAGRILRTPARVTQHVAVLVDLCTTMGFDGIDLDWESLRPRDRDRYSAFVTELGARLHEHGKMLAIAVHAKESEPGTWRGPQAQDWAALGAAVDEFKVMTYDYSGSWSVPGPIAPPVWVDAVLQHAESLVPAGKIWMGVPFYGYDWRRRRTADVFWSDAQALIAAHAPSITRDSSGEPSFGYVDATGVTHAVWYQDRDALAVKLDLLRTSHPSVGGIAIWVMGGEDPSFWDEIATQLR